MHLRSQHHIKIKPLKNKCITETRIERPTEAHAWRERDERRGRKQWKEKKGREVKGKRKQRVMNRDRCDLLKYEVRSFFTD